MVGDCCLLFMAGNQKHHGLRNGLQTTYNKQCKQNLFHILPHFAFLLFPCIFLSSNYYIDYHRLHPFKPAYIRG